MQGLLLDIGGVVIRTPFELLAPAERRLGLPAGALGARGILDVDGDPAFAQVLAGTSSERSYWADRADRAAQVLGTDGSTRSFMQTLFDLPAEDVVRPEVHELVVAASASRVPVGLLTNDVGDFHGPGWVESLPVYAHVVAMVDGSVTGVLKPDPEAFRLGVAALGLPADRIVFVDDQPANVAAAAAADVGLRAIRFDVVDPAGSVAEVRRALDLG